MAREGLSRTRLGGARFPAFLPVRQTSTSQPMPTSRMKVSACTVGGRGDGNYCLRPMFTLAARSVLCSSERMREVECLNE
jgi:hypothetical protein